jgi:hypothetical protein
MKNSSHLLAQHGELLQVSAVITGEPLNNKEGRFLKAIGVAALCIAVAAGAGHVTQGIREEAARVAAAEKAKEERLAEEKRTAAAKVVGLQKRLTAMQTQISTERDALQERFQRLLADKDQDTAVAEMLRQHPAPYKPLQGIDPVAFEAFIDLDRESWIATGTSPKLDEHYQAERAKIQAGAEYLRYVNEALELQVPVSPAQPAASRSVPSVPVAPGPVMPLEKPAPTPTPAAKPRTAPTGVQGKVRVLDW